jgi:hypothetical protein
MSFYGETNFQSMEDLANSNELMEMFLYDDLSGRSEEEIKKFCESADAQVLMEKQVLNKQTLNRLSKKDDFKRRVVLISYQLAKEAKDPAWTKLVKFQAKRKECKRIIINKYAAKAERIAKSAQRNYIQTAKSMKATDSEKKAQAAR